MIPRALSFTRLCALACAASLPCAPAWAGPAEDALAQATELRRMLISQDERLARLEKQLHSQGLLNLLNQVETLKAEVARLRGSQEEQTYRLDNADKRARELFADFDGRIKELASRPAAAPADAIRLQVSQSLAPTATPLAVTPPAATAPAAALTPVTATPATQDGEAETRAYTSAHALVRSGKYKDAVAAFQTFLKQYPEGSLAANALYWTGVSYAALSDFASALTSYQRLLKDFPSDPKVPDTMLSLARAQVQLNQPEQARATLEQLIGAHPQSRAAEGGKRLLATLK
ncbi:MAG: TPR repeat-containing protein [bacterium]|nr:MAG: TPR repeat-containing protein [bacterium]KAF0149176.1 MAG: TPR repeat-containing protein [bacterium]KAF0168813.1 MAG: TPR repeat-containing protein [bacterium]TXT20907.1 MAG: TPR repeat-containing protein [bacterium]